MMISDVNGSFKTYDGKLTLTTADFTDAKIEYSAEENSINREMKCEMDTLKAPISSMQTNFRL
ncbi:hypothetical protein MCERE19_02965 [Spirosomataceae bacterium]|jgi:polyisoprenoid-binding protein YceI